MKLIILLLLGLNVCTAQQKSIDFNRGLSWDQIKIKAKKENKYIFLDGYTTWCAPCKDMEEKIFPLEDVVDFFNKNFISVSIQFDLTSKDSKEIKARYVDANNIKKMYEVSSYPTYLFFNPEGHLVHKIIGASFDPKEFILKAKLALDPKSQYVTLKEQYQKGKRDTLFLRGLIDAAIAADLNSLPIYVNAYLPQLKKEEYKSKLKLIYYGTSKTSEFSFKLLQDFSKEIDSLYGIRSSHKIINRLIFYDYVFPHLRINGKIIRNRFMISYEGDINPKVNWEEIEKKIKNIYPQTISDILRFSKSEYYTWTSNWSEYSKMVNDYIKDSFNEVSSDELSDYANTIFQNCNDNLILKEAKDWVGLAISLDKGDSLKYRHIDARLSYKLGNKEIAIRKMEEVVRLADGRLSWLADELAKMKLGEKTW
jgi:thioredoxin-related protein